MTKVDLAEAVGFDREAAYDSIRRVAPAIRVLEVATRTGAGLDAWFVAIEERLTAKRSHEGTVASEREAVKVG